MSTFKHLIAVAALIPPKPKQRLGPLRLAFLAFCAAAAGAFLSFIATSMQIRWLSVIAFIVVAASVIVGFAAILWGWYWIFTGRQKK